MGIGRFVAIEQLQPAAGIILCTISSLTLTAISVDRLLALLLGLRYRQVVTLKRAFLVIVSFWTVSTVFSTVRHF